MKWVLIIFIASGDFHGLSEAEFPTKDECTQFMNRIERNQKVYKASYYIPTMTCVRRLSDE